MSMSSREAHRRMPSVEKIFNYWYEHRDKFSDTCKDEGGINEKECFACGSYDNIQRCHIIPHCAGGSNDVTNIHLLCAGCHVESEGLKPYWTWLNWKRKNEWDYGVNHIQKRLITCGLDIDYFAQKDTDREKYIKKFVEQLYW